MVHQPYEERDIVKETAAPANLNFCKYTPIQKLQEELQIGLQISYLQTKEEYSSLDQISPQPRKAKSQPGQTRKPLGHIFAPLLAAEAGRDTAALTFPI